MHSRIITGLFGGQKIVTPGDDLTHPMSEKIRNAIFNSLGQKVLGVVVADLFAGSGALGLECLSRQAKQVVFVDKSARACQVIRQNVDSLGQSDKVEIIKSTVSSWLEQSAQLRFDIIFIDPPYDSPQLDSFRGVDSILGCGSKLIVSMPTKLPDVQFTSLRLARKQVYGSAKILFFEK